MRYITSHKLNGLNDKLNIFIADAPGSGGACHEYKIEGIHGPDEPPVRCAIYFQNGPMGEAGLNGISNESLLAILIDRLQGFQGGEFKCRENAIALTHLEDAMHWLQHRTRQRLNRGVEGTSIV
jgi:hypothetical protein